MSLLQDYFWDEATGVVCRRPLVLFLSIDKRSTSSRTMINKNRASVSPCSTQTTTIKVLCFLHLEWWLLTLLWCTVLLWSSLSSFLGPYRGRILKPLCWLNEMPSWSPRHTMVKSFFPLSISSIIRRKANICDVFDRPFQNPFWFLRIQCREESVRISLLYILAAILLWVIFLCSF